MLMKDLYMTSKPIHPAKLRRNVVMRRVFSSLCKRTGSRFAEKANGLFQSNDHNKLLEHLETFDPSSYHSASLFAEDYAIKSYLSKYTGLETGIDTKAVALHSFIKNEGVCWSTNERLLSTSHDRLKGHTHAAILAASKIIGDMLGSFSYDKVRKANDWGPGATDDLPRRKAQPDLKLVTLPITVTRGALDVLRHEIETDLHWAASILQTYPCGPFSLLPHNFTEVRGSLVGTVLKNAKTDRVICTEPRGNMFLQKGVGGYFRSRLLAVGIDLDDQGNNQRAAQAAIFDFLATIDLKAASDTISIELVRALLPSDWFAYLDAIRSKSSKLEDGRWLRLEKFSSMGNGFTFELETLIFYALARAACVNSGLPVVALVYGDDIIVKQEIAPLLIDIYGEVGFATNLDKTFTKGRFFESCGAHYFDGIDVTPAYQKDQTFNYDNQDGTEGETFLVKLEVIMAHNRLMKLGRTLALNRGISPIVYQSCMLLREFYFTSWGHCPYAPLDSGHEGSFHVTASERLHGRGYRLSYGYRFKTIVPKTLTIPANGLALLALTLRRFSDSTSVEHSCSHLNTRAASAWVRGDDLTIPSGGYKEKCVWSSYYTNDDWLFLSS